MLWGTYVEHVAKSDSSLIRSGFGRFLNENDTGTARNVRIPFKKINGFHGLRAAGQQAAQPGSSKVNALPQIVPVLARHDSACGESTAPHRYM